MTIITDLYQSLFGKNHIQDGNVIDMAEHGRMGGLSTGQAFKFTSKAQQTLRLSTNASLTFVGRSSPGINATLPYWQIMAITLDESTVIYASGTDAYDKVWTLRESYVYS